MGARFGWLLIAVWAGVSCASDDPPSGPDAGAVDASRQDAKVEGASKEGGVGSRDAAGMDARRADGGASNPDAAMDAGSNSQDASDAQDAAADAQPDEDAAAGGGDAGVLCLPKGAMCRQAEPTCPEGEVASIEGSCWGPCVPIQSCPCAAADDCPHREKYTCWNSTGHCNYYGP